MRMEIGQAIRGRRAIRKFTGQEVADSLIEEILDLARNAPSSMNGQPWHFIVVRDAEAKKRLAEVKNAHCAPDKRDFPSDFLQHAPVVVIVCVEKKTSFNREIENGIMAAAHILLVAHARGLGSVYTSAQMAGDPDLAEELRELFEIPGDFAPISVLPLGYPAEPPAPKAMRLLGDMVSFEVMRGK